MVHHYSRLTLGALLGLLLLPALSTGALAADPVVNVTVSAYVIGIPGGFTVTYTSDYEVGIEWTKPGGAENTMVRAAIGHPPANRTDGYLVYYGDAESCTDTGVSLDETAAPVIYRAWSETAGGAWSPLFAEGEIEGIGMVLIAFAVLIVALMALGYIFKHGLLFLAAGFAAVGLGFILFGEEALSTRWMFGWAAVVVSLVCFVQALLTWMALRPGRVTPEIRKEEYKRRILSITKRRPKYPY